MRGIEEYDKFGTLKTLYYSVDAAAKALNISSTLLLKIVESGEIYNRKMYKYFDCVSFSTGNTIFPIKQYNMETGEIINQFRTITDAAKELNYHRNNIYMCMKNNTTDRWGYGWKRSFDVD